MFYKRYVLSILTTVFMLNLVDRGLMLLLLQSIKDDLNLSDTQLGSLTGIVFGLFYASFGVPIARWADRGNRVTITSLAIGLWGLTVMACLFVSSFVHLAFARMAAAIGEAGCKPPTYSLVGDYFPEPKARTRAMAIYMMGSPLAALVSFIVGGWLNERYGWRMTFFLMGIPGLLVAALVKLTVKEPRTPEQSAAITAHTFPPMQTVLRTLWTQRSFRHISIALILLYTLTLGLGPWYAAFMIRSHGMGTRELGVWLGLIFSLGGIVGVLVGGYVATRWFVNNERGQMRLTAATIVALVPCYIVFLTVPHKYEALFTLAPLMAVLYLYLGPTYALMQRLVVDEMRATTMSLVMLLANFVGMGIGPQIVGILSDALAPLAGRDSLRYAMLSMSGVALWSAYHFWRVGTFVDEDLSGVARAHAVRRPALAEDDGALRTAP